MNDLPLPSRSELKAAYDDIARIHRTHLAQHGVRLPDENSYKWVWLAMLHHHKGRVSAVADVGPVRRASLPVQRKIWDFLRRRFG